MKKTITIIIALLLTFNAFALDIWDGSASPWTQGTGVSSDPYLIETAENLAYLAQKVNEGYQAQGMAVFKGVYFLMTDDLDLNNINWTPIGNVNMNMQGYYFAGIFDGWYHNIDHLKIQTSADVCGLFAGLGGYKDSPLDDNGTIRRLSVTNGNITSTGTGAAGIVGGISGNATVDQCSFSGSISVSSNGTYCGAGGIVAAAAEDSNIIECSFHGSITATNSAFTGAAGAGGIVGIAMDDVHISFCYNTGNITSNALLLSVAAGIVGATLQENSVSIFCCYNIGTLNASTKGGIFGMVSPINPTKNESYLVVDNCYYLNTCGGTTNYGTSMAASEMQTYEFMFMIDQISHRFAMDNGTNNGYPVNGLVGIKVYQPSDITAHSAYLSAELHPGNHSFSDVLFYCKDGVYDQHTVHVDTDGFVEATMEPLLADTQYLYLLGVTFSDGFYQEFGTGYFITEVDGINEISNNDIHIYPNPTSDFIHIENTEPQSVTIYSLDGRLVKMVENTNVVDVRDLRKGVYLINIDGTIKKFAVWSL